MPETFLVNVMPDLRLDLLVGAEGREVGPGSVNVHSGVAEIDVATQCARKAARADVEAAAGCHASEAHALAGAGNGVITNSSPW